MKMSKCQNVKMILTNVLTASKSLASVSLLLFSSVSIAQWTDEVDGSSTIVLDTINPDVTIVAEGLDYITYGVIVPGDYGEDPTIVEFDVENVNWNRFDINTTGATNTDEEAWGWPDGRVDVADVRLFMCFYQDSSLYVDINTTGAIQGDASYGEMDGVVDISDFNYFFEWLVDYSSLSIAADLLTNALENNDPCGTRADDELGMAPRPPQKITSGITSTVSGLQPGLVGGWVYVIARDFLKPQSSLDLQVLHRADEMEICTGEPGAVHFSEAFTEVGFFASMGAVATGLTEVLNDRQYEIEEDCMGDGSGMRVGNSSLRTMYRVTYKLGVFAPIDAWWAGLGVQKTLLTRQRSGVGCGCP